MSPESIIETTSDIWYDEEYAEHEFENQKWITVEEVEKIKEKLYDLLMPDLSGKTQKAIEEAFSPVTAEMVKKE